MASAAELAILESAHRFIRNEDEEESNDLEFGDRIAVKYEQSLFREYANIDLKHYKTKDGFSLRWRTEEEVCIWRYPF